MQGVEPVCVCDRGVPETAGVTVRDVMDNGTEGVTGCA